MLSDIEIAQGCQMRPITEVAAAAGLDAEDLELYGRYKAKLSADVWKKTADKPDGTALHLWTVPLFFAMMKIRFYRRIFLCSDTSIPDFPADLQIRLTRLMMSALIWTGALLCGGALRVTNALQF